MRWLALALCITCAAPALATQDGWPALHDVTGVAADDVLNIRARPDADAPIMGTLPPDGTGIEVIRADEALEWGLVNSREMTGWASLRYLARRPGQWDGAFPNVASCFGTEPFWTLRIDGDALVWTTPEEEEAGVVEARLGASARRDRHGLTGIVGDRALAGVIAGEACSDGMSDRAYGLGFDAIFGDEVLSGCCTLAR